ncbi:MAG: hypothetical protein K0V04_17165 [Deltaproteobacteria bacterium]|nr:hypothetical protein [Deltaproteobacteria bacterium]
MNATKIHTWLGLVGLTVALTGCPGDDSGTDTAADTASPATTTGTPATTTGTPETTTGMNTTGDATTGDPGTSTGAVDSSTGAVDSSSGGDPTTGDPPGMGYGPCPCMGTQVEVMLAGVDGCYCGPLCEGMNCEDPGTGAAPQCAITQDGAKDPTVCVLVCMSGDDCPMGATCEAVPDAGVSICTHPPA